MGVGQLGRVIVTISGGPGSGDDCSELMVAF